MGKGTKEDGEEEKQEGGAGRYSGEESKLGGEMQTFLLLIQARKDVWE